MCLLSPLYYRSSDNRVFIFFISLLCREVWREEDAMKQTMQSHKEELNRVERNLRGTVSKVYESMRHPFCDCVHSVV